MAEDIGLKIGTKEENAWKTILESAEKEIAQARRMIILNEVIMEKAEEMMKIEQDKE